MAVSPVSSVSPLLAADNASPEKIRLRNVELNAAGEVTGKLLDEQGQPIGGSTVHIRNTEHTYRQTTAADGSFTIKSANGGNCAVVVGETAYPFRTWVHGTAPPKSLKSIGIAVGDKPVVRAQDGDEGFGFINGVTGSQLLGLGLLAGAIVAIILAIDNDQDGS